MKVFETLDNLNIAEDTVVALGNFDGIHRGHRELIQRSVKSAEAAGMKSAVFTFSNHPRNLLGKGTEVKNILYPEDKIHILQNLGVDYLFSIPFTKEIQELSPVEFIDQLLIGHFHMKEAYCGYNFRFGKKAHGDVEILIREGLKKGFGIHVMEPYLIEGEPVNSTMIRKLIESGQVDQCEKYLGRYYSILGEVVVGNKLGKQLGFPTSNLIMDESMVAPPNGVYITYCVYDGKRYPSITNVGEKPTIGNYEKNVETHIFNFDYELYGKKIRVEFLKRTREEVKFGSISQLSRQITEDCINAKAFHFSTGMSEPRKIEDIV